MADSVPSVPCVPRTGGDRVDAAHPPVPPGRQDGRPRGRPPAPERRRLARGLPARGRQLAQPPAPLSVRRLTNPTQRSCQCWVPLLTGSRKGIPSVSTLASMMRIREPGQGQPKRQQQRERQRQACRARQDRVEATWVAAGPHLAPGAGSPAGRERGPAARPACPGQQQSRSGATYATTSSSVELGTVPRRPPVGPPACACRRVGRHRCRAGC